MEDEEINSPETWNNAPAFEFCISFKAVRNFDWGSEIYRGRLWREKDENGKETGINGYLVAPGKEGMMWCRASNMDEFAAYIEKILQMRCDEFIHCDPGLTGRLSCDLFCFN